MGGGARTRNATRACLLLLVALVVDNLVFAWKADERLPPRDQLGVSPRDLELIALSVTHPAVRARLANFYFLEKHLAGDEILIPKRHEQYAWHFKHIARMRVVVAEQNLVIRSKKIRRLRALVREHGEYNRRWFFGKIADRRFYQRFRILVDHSVNRYVLAETESGKELFLLPRKTFNAFRAPPRIEAGPRSVFEEPGL